MASIQGIYVALFGRPADPAGLAYFNQATANGANLSAIGDLSATPEFQTRFAAMSRTEIINTIYRSLFERDAEPAGLNFFLAAWEAGTFSINTIAIAILDGAQNDDRKMVDAKIAAANIFNERLDTVVEIAAYAGLNAADIGRQFLLQVDKDQPGTASLADYYISLLTSQGGQEPGGGNGGNSGGNEGSNPDPDPVPTLGPVGIVSGFNGPFYQNGKIVIAVTFGEDVSVNNAQLHLTGDRVAELDDVLSTDNTLVFTYCIRGGESAPDIDVKDLTGVTDAAGRDVRIDETSADFNGIIIPPDGEVHVYGADGELDGIYSRGEAPDGPQYEGVWHVRERPINAAVIQSAADNTIMVGSGQYNTGNRPIVLDKPGLTLLGAQVNADYNPLTMRSDDTPGAGYIPGASYITGRSNIFSVEADDIEINGFVLGGLNAPAGDPVDIITTRFGGQDEGLIIASNVIFGASGNGISIVRHDSVEVSGNIIFMTGGYAVLVNKPYDEISDVQIRDNVAASNNIMHHPVRGPFGVVDANVGFFSNAIIANDFFSQTQRTVINGTNGDDIFIFFEGLVDSRIIVRGFDVAHDKISIVSNSGPLSFVDLNSEPGDFIDGDDDGFIVQPLNGGRLAYLDADDKVIFALVGVVQLSGSNIADWTGI